MSNNKQKIVMDYIPHGINHHIFKPVEENDDNYQKFLKDYYKNKYNSYDFIVLYNNRNIKRKMPGDVILAFAEFARSLPKKKKDKVLLVMHTHVVDKAGTDLKKVYDDLFSDVNVKFSNQKYRPELLNYIYNSADVVINLANNEGYGLATAESLMSGTPIIATVTGGLQDQMGFEGVLNQEEFDSETKPSCGDWVYPVWPSTRCLQGSPPTPYIFADYISYKDATRGLKYWYQKSNEERKTSGQNGRNYLIDNGHTVESMINSFDEIITKISENWKPRQRIFIKSC